MKRFTIVITALVISAALASPALAQRCNGGRGYVNGHRGHFGHPGHFQQHNFHHGHFHQQQQFVHVRQHCYRGWSNYCYLPRHGCHGYYCPNARNWYYWYAPRNCFLPINHIQQFAPTPVNNINTNTNTNTNININNNINNNTPALPPGATPLPGGVAPPLPGIN